jgi:hypothetical protein
MRWLNGFVLLLLVLLSGCKEEKLAQGAPAPALAAFDLHGKDASLDSWKGKGFTSISGQQAVAVVWLKWTPCRRSANSMATTWWWWR